MLIRQRLLKVRYLTNLPQKRHRALVARQLFYLVVLDQRRQRLLVLRRAHTDQCGIGRACIKTPQQCLRAREVELVAAPVEGGERLEFMLFHGPDKFLRHRAELRSRSEGAVAHMPPGAAGDLRDLRRGKAPYALPVELRQPCKGHMIKTEIEAHADSIGCDKIIDLAAFKHLDLRISGAGRKGSQHHGGAASLAPDRKSTRLNSSHVASSYGRAWRLAGYLSASGVGQFGKARPGYDLTVRDERGQKRADCLRP